MAMTIGVKLFGRRYRVFEGPDGEPRAVLASEAERIDFKGGGSVTFRDHGEPPAKWEGPPELFPIID